MWVGEPPSWSVRLELAATQVELLHGACRLLMQLAGAKRHQLPQPVRIPRPVDKTRRPARPGFDPERFTSYLMQLQDGK